MIKGTELNYLICSKIDSVPQQDFVERTGASLTHPSSGIEFSQQEEDVLMARFKRFVLAGAVAVFTSHHKAGGQLPEAGCNVRPQLIQLSQLTA